MIRPDDDPELEPLRADRVGGLRFLLGSRFTPSTLAHHLAVNPALSWRAARSGQYVVGGYWRRRPDIAAVVELATGRYRHELLDRLVESARAVGCELVIGEAVEGDGMAALWREVGFAPVDQILEYERLAVWAGPGAPGSPVLPVRPYRPEDLRPTLELDRRSFPWLWWNSTAELAHYGDADGSEVWLLDGPDGRVAGYVGLTVRGTRGHLDRLAVAPELRRRGLGAGLIGHALSRFAAHGVRRVTLTTQYDNTRAQPLYERFGFGLTRYRLTIYGRWLGQPRDRTP
ncbi:MAG TPA: GNAT family N-acetyltransferase [Chloroflexota bacterium]|nr:GNAT family N-acetyltransferase [Chloroflexota bacterium]